MEQIYTSSDGHGVRILSVKEHGVNKQRKVISENTALVYHITLLAHRQESHVCYRTVEVCSVERDLLCRNESLPMSLVEDGGVVPVRFKSSNTLLLKEDQIATTYLRLFDLIHAISRRSFCVSRNIVAPKSLHFLTRIQR